MVCILNHLIANVCVQSMIKSYAEISTSPLCTFEGFYYSVICTCLRFDLHVTDMKGSSSVLGGSLIFLITAGSWVCGEKSESMNCQSSGYLTNNPEAKNYPFRVFEKQTRIKESRGSGYVEKLPGFHERTDGCLGMWLF
jgi:hypothetical protein